ncbi:hypothetical protein IRB23M11_15230 [Alkalibacterium sp. m-11]
MNTLFAYAKIVRAINAESKEDDKHMAKTKVKEILQSEESNKEKFSYL